jgi:hypothetical protein
MAWHFLPKWRFAEPGQMHAQGQKATKTIRTALITFHQLAILPD